MSYIGRRKLYLWGLGGLATILFIVGFISVGAGDSSGGNYAQAAMMLIWLFWYYMTVGPICYAIGRARLVSSGEEAHLSSSSGLFSGSRRQRDGLMRNWISCLLKAFRREALRSILSTHMLMEIMVIGNILQMNALSESLGNR